MVNLDFLETQTNLQVTGDYEVEDLNTNTKTIEQVTFNLPATYEDDKVYRFYKNRKEFTIKKSEACLEEKL